MELPQVLSLKPNEVLTVVAVGKPLLHKYRKSNRNFILKVFGKVTESVEERKSKQWKMKNEKLKLQAISWNLIEPLGARWKI